MIRPEFWTSEQVMRMPRDARLAFIGLWNFCDDAGNHPASAFTLNAQVFPGDDDVTLADTESMVTAMHEQGLVVTYHAEGRDFWHVTGWRRHQFIKKPTSKYPPFPQDSDTTFPPVPKSSPTSTPPVPHQSGSDSEPVHPGVVIGIGIGIGNGNGGGIARAREGADSDNPPPPPPVATRLETAWELPAVWRDWALQRRPELDPDLMAARFHNHFLAAPAPGGLKADWQATWQSWVLDEDPKRHARNGYTPPAPHARARDPALEKIDRDALLAVPMPDATRERIAAIKAAAHQKEVPHDDV